MRTITYAFLLLSLFFASIGWGAGADLDNEGAVIQKIAAKVVEAAKKQAWEDYADLIDPDSLKLFKSSFLPGLKSAEKQGQKEQSETLLLFDGARDIASLIKMDPKEFLVRFIKAKVSRSLGIKDEFGSMNAKIIGIVHEDKDLVHVIARLKKNVDGTAVSNIIVISLKRSRKEWKVLQTPELIIPLGGKLRLGYGD